MTFVVATVMTFVVAIVVTFVEIVVVTFVATVVVIFVATVVAAVVATFVATVVATFVATGEGIAVVMVVVIIHIVGLQDVHHTAEAKITHHRAHPMLGGLGGRDPGPFHILLIAQTGGMLVDLGEMWLACVISICEQSKKNLFTILS